MYQYLFSLWILLAIISGCKVTSDDSAHTFSSDAEASANAHPPPAPLSQLETHPQLAIHQLSYLSDQGLVQVRYGVFGATKGELAATDQAILFLLGRGEWIEKYIPIYTELFDQLGQPIAIVDYIGQGGSGGVRGHISSYDSYSDLLEFFVTHHLPHADYSIVAHSMGGMIALYSTLKATSPTLSPQKLVLSAPLIRLRKTSIPSFVAKPLTHILSHVGKEQMRSGVKSEIDFSFEDNRLTSDPQKYQQYQNTPYPIPSATMGWVNATYKASDHIFNRHRISQYLPATLVFLGEHEQVVSAQGVKDWVHLADQHSPAAVELVRVEDARHELFYERESTVQEILRITVDFLR